MPGSCPPGSRPDPGPARCSFPHWTLRKLRQWFTWQTVTRILDMTDAGPAGQAQLPARHTASRATRALGRCLTGRKCRHVSANLRRGSVCARRRRIALGAAAESGQQPLIHIAMSKANDAARPVQYTPVLSCFSSSLDRPQLSLLAANGALALRRAALRMLSTALSFECRIIWQPAFPEQQLAVLRDMHCDTWLQTLQRWPQCKAHIQAPCA